MTATGSSIVTGQTSQRDDQSARPDAAADSASEVATAAVAAPDDPKARPEPAPQSAPDVTPDTATSAGPDTMPAAAADATAQADARAEPEVPALAPVLAAASSGTIWRRILRRFASVSPAAATTAPVGDATRSEAIAEAAPHVSDAAARAAADAVEAAPEIPPASAPPDAAEAAAQIASAAAPTAPDASQAAGDVAPSPASEAASDTTIAAAAAALDRPLAPDASAPTPAVAIAMRAITRRFGAVPANDAVDLEINEGEIVALIGDNGAGKTTLMNILCGRDIADSGSILLPDGLGRLLPLTPGSQRAAIDAGIAMVGSPAALAENLTALQNIMLGTQSLWRPRLSRQSARKRVADLMQRLNIRIELDVPLARLPAGDRLRAAILRAFHRPVRVLALDEPTATLTPPEAESLFRTLRTLARDGLAVIISSRKLDETIAFADRVVVLREGRRLADFPAAGTDRGVLEALISDRPTQKVTPTFHAGSRSIVELRKVDAVTGDARLHQVSLEVRSGEIVGVAGVANNGQDALAAVVAGQVRPTRGEMYLFGRRLARFDAAAFGRAGVGRIPKDRRLTGVVASMSVTENLIIEDVGRPWLHQGGFLKSKTIREYANEIIHAYGLDCPDPDAPLADLPATTAEMLVLFRMLDHKPRLIVAEQPTRGLNAGLAAEVHRQLDFERQKGTAILLISDDIDELFALADSISVIHRGRITVPHPNGAFDRTRLGFMMGSHGSLAQDWAGWGGGT